MTNQNEMMDGDTQSDIETPDIDTGVDTSETEAPQNGDKPEGYDHVDFQTASREDIERRFRRIYGQMKRQDAVIRQMSEDQRALYDKLQQDDAIKQQETYTSRAEQIQRDMQEAIDEGNAAKVAALSRELAEIEVNKVLSNQSKQPQQKQTAQRPQQADTSDLPQEDADAIASWAENKPHAMPGHQHRGWVAFQLNDLYTNPETAHLSISQKLREVDRRYAAYAGTTQKRSNPDVVGDTGSARRPGRKRGVQLTDDEKAVAVRIFPDKPYDEALALYAKGKN